MKKINLEHMIHTLRGENTWITARQLSTLLHISTRSVRNYVTEINKMHPEPLIEASRYGYRIVVREQRLLLPQEDRKEIPGSPQGRVWYLARQIIYRDSIGTDPLSFDEGTDRLRISDRSMEKDINQLRKLLSDYGVRLRASSGILTIQGKERNVRNLIYDCICHFASDRMLTISDILRAFPGFPVEAVSTAVSETVDRAGMICDPYHRNGLLLYLIIQSIRIRNHHLIRPGDFRGEILETPPRNAITRRLAERLGTSLGVSFSASELDYLSVLLFCFCAEKNPSQEKYVDVCNRLAQDLQHLSNWIGEPYDGTLICTLADMLVRMRVRSLMGIRTFHPLSSPLRNEMPQLYDSVVWILGDFEALWNVRFDRYDISAFALPICIYARLHQGIAPRIRCTLICPDTMGLTGFVLEKLERHFGSQLEITDVIDSLDFLDLPENEMFISLIPLKKNQHYVRISPILSSNDYMAIRKELVRIEAAKRYQSFYQYLCCYSSPNLFVRNLSFSDQKAVISYISDVLKSKGYVDEDFKKTILEREATDNTCFHNLVAIPHATLASVKKNVIYILLNDRPIRWGNREANLVILVAMEHDLIPDFRLFYKTLVKIMACSDNMDSLLKTYTYGEFLNAIQGMQDL